MDIVGNVTVDEANKIKHFPKKDGRKQNVLNLDPRIHFALSYLTNSSPRVIFLALDRIDQQLEYAAQKFCTAITVDQTSNTVRLVLSHVELCWHLLLRFICRVSSSGTKEISCPRRTTLTQTKWICCVLCAIGLPTSKWCSRLKSD